MTETSKAFTDKLIYIVPSEFPDLLLQSVIDYCDSHEHRESQILGDIEHSSCERSTRSSKNAWINWDSWMPGILHNIMISANREFFNYDLNYFASAIQSTVYDGNVDDHYTWHHDNMNIDYKQYSGERKLSLSMLLTDPDEYTGGELQFSYGGQFFESLKPRKGDCIIFPSWLLHRVRPVTSGCRKSVVAWMMGPHFK